MRQIAGAGPSIRSTLWKRAGRSALRLLGAAVLSVTLIGSTTRLVFAQGTLCGIGFTDDPATGEMPVQITNNETKTTYCGTGIPTGFNYETKRMEYSYTVAVPGLSFTRTGTYTITPVNMQIGMRIGIFDLTDITMDGGYDDFGGGDGDPWVDFPPDVQTSPDPFVDPTVYALLSRERPQGFFILASTVCFPFSRRLEVAV